MGGHRGERGVAGDLFGGAGGGGVGGAGEYRAIVNVYPALRDLTWDDFCTCQAYEISDWLGATLTDGSPVTFGHRKALNRLHTVYGRM